MRSGAAHSCWTRKRSKIRINSILFGGEIDVSALARNQPQREEMLKRLGKRLSNGEEFLKKIAADSGGTYRFVPDNVEK